MANKEKECADMKVGGGGRARSSWSCGSLVRGMDFVPHLMGSHSRVLGKEVT